MNKPHLTVLEKYSATQASKSIASRLGHSANELQLRTAEHYLDTSVDLVKPTVLTHEGSISRVQTLSSELNQEPGAEQEVPLSTAVLNSQVEVHALSPRGKTLAGASSEARAYISIDEDDDLAECGGGAFDGTLRDAYQSFQPGIWLNDEAVNVVLATFLTTKYHFISLHYRSPLSPKPETTLAITDRKLDERLSRRPFSLGSKAFIVTPMFLSGITGLWARSILNSRGLISMTDLQRKHTK